jgi:hypothetical protein
MNKRVLLLTASLLALAMLVTPAMSVSPKKIPVELSFALPPTFIPAPKRWITGNAQHGIGETAIRTDYSIIGEGVSLTGGISTYYDGKYNFNLENGYGAKQFKILIDFGDGNTFEGNLISRGIFRIRPSGWAQLYPNGTRHAVLQGTGAYKGWTLVWTHERIGGVNQGAEAYLLMP